MINNYCLNYGTKLMIIAGQNDHSFFSIVVNRSKSTGYITAHIAANNCNRYSL